jgi:hypothetical protein
MSNLFKHTIKGADVLSLYPIIYVSSKGDPMLIDDAEAMNDFRLVTVRNKLAALDERPGDVGRLFEALDCEVVRRGLDPKFKGGRPPLAEPPLEEGFA